MAEETFGSAAKAISSGESSNQRDVRKSLDKLLPPDIEFKQWITGYGSVSVSRAKYLLAMLERSHRQRAGMSLDGLPDWSSKSVTIEHILAKSKKDDEAASLIDQLGNLTLLEKALNKNLDDRPFDEKRALYANSTFELTKSLASRDSWSSESISQRVTDLAELACIAWPDQV